MPSYWSVSDVLAEEEVRAIVSESAHVHALSHAHHSLIIRHFSLNRWKRRKCQRRCTRAVGALDQS